MVSIEKFLTNYKTELEKEIKYRNEISELSLAHRFVAARKIQAWFRGFITRQHLRMINKSATTIQRHWRGFIARKYVKWYLKEIVIKMWLDYYKKCAIKIQALWRGYRSRKYGVNLPKYKQWLQTVYKKNNEALIKMKEFRNLELNRMKNIIEEESMIWILFILFKLHHLLGTKSKPGVLTIIDKTRFTVIEKMIRSLEYTLYIEKKREDQCREKSLIPRLSSRLIFKNTYFARCEKEIRDYERSMETGKASILRDSPYEDEKKLLKNMEKNLRDELNFHKNGRKKLPFKTIVNSKTENNMIRVTIDDYNPPKFGFTSINRSREKSKELNGDFKTNFKPKELYEAINQMDCQFYKLKLKCPIHDLNIKEW